MRTEKAVQGPKRGFVRCDARPRYDKVNSRLTTLKILAKMYDHGCALQEWRKRSNDWEKWGRQPMQRSGGTCHLAFAAARWIRH